MSAVPADLRIESPWRIALPAFVAFVSVILLLYRETAMAMAAIWWRSETFAHAMLVPPITVWLIWRQRERLAALKPAAQPRMLLPMLAVAGVWLLSRLVIVDAASQFAFVAMLVLAVPTVMGFEVTGVILFPLLFLFFAVPFGEFALPTMMQMTADFTVAALRASGVPVFREGQQFVIPTGPWSVIDECSGVRYLMASFMVGTLFAYLSYRSYKRRAIFMLVSLVVPVVANWLRAYLIVMVAYVSGNRIATGVDHVIYGWVFFGLIIFALYRIGSAWSEEPAASPPATGATGLSGVHPGTRPMLSAVLLGTLVALVPHLALGVLGRVADAASPARFELPKNLGGGWSDTGAQGVAWKPLFDNPAVESSRTYAGPAGTVVGVHLAYYRGQNEDRKLISSENVLVAMRDHEWNQMVGDVRDTAAVQGTVSVNTAELLGQPRPGSVERPHLTVWRVYWVDGQFIAGDVAAKVASAWAQLRGHGDDGASIVLYVDGESTQASAATLSDFVRSNFGTLNALLRRTRETR